MNQNNLKIKYYNNSCINENDGLVVYISDYITEMTEAIDINNLTIIISKMAIENNREILLSAPYRSRSKTDFL